MGIKNKNNSIMIRLLFSSTKSHKKIKKRLSDHIIIRCLPFPSLDFSFFARVGLGGLNKTLFLLKKEKK